MSKKIYTYTDLVKLPEASFYDEIKQYPQIVVSADLKKGIIGTVDLERISEVIKTDANLKITEFRNIIEAIYSAWNSDQTKFNQMIILSEFMRKKIADAGEDKAALNWLTGCIRNLDSILSSINLLEQAFILPEHLGAKVDRNQKLLIEAWEYLLERDKVIPNYRKRIAQMTTKEAWEPVLNQAFKVKGVGETDTLVIHGFYYFTPIQQHIIQLLEQAGYNLIYLFPYDERYRFVYEIWEDTYTRMEGFPPKSEWKIESSNKVDSYGEIFEGKKDVVVPNNLEIKEYASVMEFVDDVKKIKKNGFTIYSANQQGVNKILKDYFPEEYGDRKILAYPIGQFVSTLNKMWDEELNTIRLDEDNLIDCFASGWLSVNGISGKQYMQDLMHILPFFSGCVTIEQWEERIEKLKQIKEEVINPFAMEYEVEPAIARWQEAIENPFKNFSMFSVDTEKLDIILTLIKQLLDMAKELFGSNKQILVSEHLGTLDRILKQHEISSELYEEERSLIGDIFEKLNQPSDYTSKCSPADIARALDLFITGRMSDGEIEVDRVGFVRPMFFIEAEAIKNRSRAHICMCDVDTMPGGNKEYIWPLTEELIRDCYERTHNSLIQNIMQIMSSTVLCNRYFLYSGLKNKDVCLSWISNMNDKLLAPSPYIKLLCEATGRKLEPAKRNTITFARVAETDYGRGRTDSYDNEKAPKRMIKEARMAYALCPMKYTLGYVLEKFPTFESDFQQNYAINALISAIYNLLKDQGITMDKVYENVMELFPALRKVEKRQVKDYISYDRREDDMSYGNRSECGGYHYTDERLKMHYPNQEVREVVIDRFGKFVTPDGRKGLDLNEVMEATSDEEMHGRKDMVKMACVFCPESEHCRNAIYSLDQENYYD